MTRSEHKTNSNVHSYVKVIDKENINNIKNLTEVEDKKIDVVLEI